MVKKIGLYGGSFNPPHLGHLFIAKEVLKKFALDKIIFIPTGIQPLKPIEMLADQNDRYKMTKFLVKKDKQFAISDLEIKQAKRNKKSYTVETLAKLKKKYPKDDLYFIIGQDSLGEILQEKWKDGLSLFSKIKFIVVSRRGYKAFCAKLNKNQLSKIAFLKINNPISSTKIREKIKKGQTIKKFVLKEVLKYIMDKKLYQTRASRKIYLDLQKIPEHLFLGPKKAEKIIERKAREIQQYCRQFGFQRGIIGLSGGLDSAVSVVLAVRALGAKNIIVVRMPYLGVSSQQSLIDAQQLAEALKISKKNILTVSINKPVDGSWQVLKRFKNSNSKIRKGNLMARERMKILFDLSFVFGALVIGTEDRTEEELGYYTLWGDQASGIEPIRNLWKTQVYQLASFMKEIPDKILLKAPSPDLWKGQTAEGEMKINYLETDIVLSAWKDLKISKKKNTQKFGTSQEKINKIFNQAKIGQVKKSIPFVLKN